jgi:putative transposase
MSVFETMPSALRFRIYPSYSQEARMLKVLEACRHLWNDALSHRRDRWQNERRSTSYNLQQWILTAERHSDPELGALYSQVAQNVLHRLDRAFQAFFKGQMKYPRFKKFSDSGSFTYPQAYNGSVKPDARRQRLFLSKVGNIRAVFHRPLPKDFRMKTCTVVREPDGKWFASLVFEEVVFLQNLQYDVITMAPIGIDLGLLSLIATSDGEKVEHPHLHRKAEKRLKFLQRIFSRKEKGSSNWFKARQRVASQHAQIRCQRRDFNHKLSTRLVKEHGFIAFEDLKIMNMVRNHALAQSIQDSGWGQLVRMTEYKAVKAGRLVVRVEPAYSTQECFFCGFVNPVDLSEREFVCRGCRRTLDRDVNAAKVVLNRAYARVGQDMPEPTPVEAAPLLLQSTEGASATIEAGTIRP